MCEEKEIECKYNNKQAGSRNRYEIDAVAPQPNPMIKFCSFNAPHSVLCSFQMEYFLLISWAMSLLDF